MGATYTRQSSFTDGDVITADLFNNEYDQLLAAFASSTGHTHDGTAGEGGPLANMLGHSITFGSGTAGTDVVITFDGETNDGVFKWMEDEDYFEFSDDVLIATTEKLQFRDTAIYINSSVDGQLDLVADTEIQIAATTIDINGLVDISGNLSVGGNLDVTGTIDFSDSNITNAGTMGLDSIFGDTDANTSITFSGSDVITIANAGTNQVTFNDGSIAPVTDSDVDLGTNSLRFKDAYIDSATVTGNVLAGGTVEPAGDTAAGDNAAIGYTSAEGLILTGQGSTNDITIKNDADADVITIATGTTVVGIPGSLDIEGAIDVNGTANLDVVDIDGAVDMASTLAVAGVVTANAGVVVDNITIDGTEIDLSSGDLTIDVAGNIEINADGGTVTFKDGGATLGTVTSAGFSGTSAGIVVNDNNANTNFPVVFHDESNGLLDDTGAFLYNPSTGTLTGTALDISGDIDVDGTSNLDIVDIDGAVNMATTALVTGVLTTTAATVFNGGFASNANSTVGGTLGVTGVVTANAGVVVDNITIDGTEIDLSSGSLTLDVAGDIILDSDDANWRFKDDGTSILEIGAGGGGGGPSLFSAISDADMIFKGNDGGSAITALTLDMSAAGAATFNSTVTSTGLIANTAGTSNFRAGVNAGDAIASNGNFNVCVGDEAGTAITTGDNNTAVGYAALATEDAHGNNTAIGWSTLKNLDAGAEGYNTAVGADAGRNVNTGTSNTLLGARSGDALTTGSLNVAVGMDALTTDRAGNRSTAIGLNALQQQNFSTSTLVYNTAVGYEAGKAVTTGVGNTLIGGLAGDALTDADFNVAIGKNALSTDTLGSFSTAVGINALETQNFTTATQTYNTAIGALAGGAVTTGTFNTLIGGKSGDAITSGDNNTAVGYSSLTTNTLSDRNVAMGNFALSALNHTTTTDAYNVGVGHSAGREITTGVENVLIGGLAGDALTDADFNVAIGHLALSSDTLGSQSVAIGKEALFTQNFTTATASNNVAIGHNAGFATTTATNNVFVGAFAGDAVTTGDNLVAIGRNALTTMTTGTANVAVGNFCLNSLTTASSNTAVGQNCGADITTGVQNTLMGDLCGDALTDADYNVAVGDAALGADTLGSRSVAVGQGALSTQNFTTATNVENVAIGYDAGVAITTGFKNTIVGALGYDNLQNGDRNISIGYDTSSSGVNDSLAILIGVSITSGGAGTARLGNSGGTATLGLDGSDTSWAAASDSRLKKDVENSTVGLEFIKDLRPVTFKWNAKDAIANTLPQYDADSSDPIYGTGKAHHGFIAQEVKAVIDSHSDVVNGHNLWSEDPDGTQQVSPSALVPMLVKAIQELEARVATLEG